MLDQRGGHIVLRAERIGGAQADIGSSGLKGLHQIGRFRRDMQAGGHAHALERLFALESFPDQPQHRHGGFGPFNLQFALIRQLDIFHIVIHWHPPHDDDR